MYLESGVQTLVCYQFKVTDQVPSCCQLIDSLTIIKMAIVYL